MNTKAELREDLDVILNILLTITQAVNGLDNWHSLSADNIKALHPFRFVTTLRYWMWYTLTIDLNKLLVNNDGQKYNLHKLLNKLVNNYARSDWRNNIELDDLRTLQAKLSGVEMDDMVDRLKTLRDRNYAHRDRPKIQIKKETLENEEVEIKEDINPILTLGEYKQLIEVARDIYNSLNYKIFNLTQWWEFSDSDTFKSIVDYITAKYNEDLESLNRKKEGLI